MDPTPAPGLRSTKILLRFVAAVVLVAIGFVLGTYAAMLKERKDAMQTPPTTQPVSTSLVSARASAVAYQGGVALYLLNPGSFCGDHPRYSCLGKLYEIDSGRLKEVAAEVMGQQVVYYKSGVEALLRSGWGDGGCRETKFYLYNFATATSTLDFSASNCDETTYGQYQRSISDYLAKFNL